MIERRRVVPYLLIAAPLIAFATGFVLLQGGRVAMTEPPVGDMNANYFYRADLLKLFLSGFLPIYAIGLVGGVAYVLRRAIQRLPVFVEPLTFGVIAYIVVAFFTYVIVGFWYG